MHLSLLNLTGAGNLQVTTTVALNAVYGRHRTMVGSSTLSYLFLISQFNDTYRENDAQKEARSR